eukprot:CAMPEP_0117438188 /NCGR_PEP_ID=MMETSP0759-20121206/1924_1 /TAXON_ID=63605 /ORGANISM="Percolomonas cosmopolitus, Strain WS" /LENGTH=69 /DNA_ID=CAMNT_0005229871 /DNA_START=64 /DNA_END=273 /DNA_ORIENTATION=+
MPAKKKGTKKGRKGGKKNLKAKREAAERDAAQKREAFFRLSSQRFLNNFYAENAFSTKFNDANVKELTE